MEKAKSVRIGKMKIEVCTRTMDYSLEPEFKDGEFVGMSHAPKYHAQIKDKPGWWGCGTSVYEAVGSLMLNHPETFGIKMEYLGRLPR